MHAIESLSANVDHLLRGEIRMCPFYLYKSKRGIYLNGSWHFPPNKETTPIRREDPASAIAQDKLIHKAVSKT